MMPVTDSAAKGANEWKVENKWVC